MKAAFSPDKTLDTVDDMTDANIIIAVVNGGEFSARSGLSTVSIAKKASSNRSIETYTGIVKQVRGVNRKLK
jgi:hypothetical protein